MGRSEKQDVASSNNLKILMNKGDPIPQNLACYIEKAGTGTLDTIACCRDAGLPEPDFEQRASQWVVTLWRDWLTAKVIAALSINDRQQKAIAKVKITGRISNSEYQELTGAIKKTATRDLDDLVSKGVLVKIGRTGRGTYYVLPRKGTKGLQNEYQ